MGPTLLSDVTTDMDVYHEEIFAPVMTCQNVDTLDDVSLFVFYLAAFLFPPLFGEGQRYSTSKPEAAMAGVGTLLQRHLRPTNNTRLFGAVLTYAPVGHFCHQREPIWQWHCSVHHQRCRGAQVHFRSGSRADRYQRAHPGTTPYVLIHGQQGLHPG